MTNSFSVDGGIPRTTGATAHRMRACSVSFDVVPGAFISGYTSIQRKIVTVITYHLILNTHYNRLKFQFEFNICPNNVAIVVLPVCRTPVTADADAGGPSN